MCPFFLVNNGTAELSFLETRFTVSLSLLLSFVLPWRWISGTRGRGLGKARSCVKPYISIGMKKECLTCASFLLIPLAFPAVAVFICGVKPLTWYWNRYLAQLRLQEQQSFPSQWIRLLAFLSKTGKLLGLSLDAWQFWLVSTPVYCLAFVTFG